jgi:hypothetical protein
MVTMTEQGFLDDVMMDALEDYIRLWDVRAVTSAAFPELSLARQIDIAKSTVRTLLDRGWVEVFQRDWMGTRPGPATPVDSTDAIAALDRLDTWDVRSTGPEYVILRTNRGAHEFAEDLRRRGRLHD